MIGIARINSHLKHHSCHQQYLKIKNMINGDVFLCQPILIYLSQQKKSSNSRGAQQFYYQFISKQVMSSLTRQCKHCNQLVREEKYQEHLNQHDQPKKHVPKTLPNSVRKIGLSKVLHLDDSTDESDIAVRSILPDDVPQPEVERRDISAPQQNAHIGKVGSGNGNRAQYMVGHASPANDQLDLNSNPVWTDVQRYEEDPLSIEKVVDLKPKKTMVARKQIHKYQNSHSAARETVDTGGCERKVQANPLSQSRNVMIAPPEPVYEIKQDVRPFLSLATDPKNTATVNFSRKTSQANPYTAIQTRSTTDPTNKGGKTSNRPSYDTFIEEPKKIEPPVDSESQVDSYQVRKGNRKHPLHPHECPDCHGFYCPTCKSTIPPSMRPFWDENEKPEMIQYYKSLQKEFEKKREAQLNCSNCNKKEEQK